MSPVDFKKSYSPVDTPYRNVCVCVCVSDTTAPSTAPALLDWATVHRMMPWNVILLLGGGFALADACKVQSVYTFWRFSSIYSADVKQNSM